MPGCTLRPIRDEDLPFLEQLYAATRANELAPVPWSSAHKAAFLQQQFAAQHAHYQAHYTGARFDVIERDGLPIGRLYVARWPREIRVVDIALIAQVRGQGVGTRLLGELLDEARQEGKTVTIHVEHTNPALRFYERLGFRQVEDKGVYLFLEWSAADASQGVTPR